MAYQSDPHLLLSVAGVKAYHIQDGEEHSLNPSGPQTLSLLMVPSNSPFSTTLPQNHTQEQDFCLHLNLPPELDLPMPASTQIYHHGSSSYLIPRWDLNPDSGAFTRIEFPRIGHGPDTVSQEDIDTFETILAQCTAFLERAAPPKPGRPLQAYNPADYAEGGKYGDQKGHGQVVLVDEDNGSVVGELADGALVVEDPSLRHGSKDPVEVEISPDGKRVSVRPISDEYLQLAKMPQYQKSSLVQNAAAASRLIVTGSSYLGNMMSSGAENFVNKTKPNAKPIEFKPATHERVRKINAFTHGAAGLSSKGVHQVSKVAQNIGAGITRRDEKKKTKSDYDGKPGLLNKSMIAFTTIADGVAYSGKTLLEQSASAASTVVGHKYGKEAGSVAGGLAGGVKNVGLVYIDVTGVTRRALVKSVAKGMVVGKMKNGEQVVVGGGDGGEVSQADLKAAEAAQQQATSGQQYGSSGQQYGSTGATGAAPPPYTEDYYGPKTTGPPGQEKGQYRY
ncbi:hypothetical protein K461DRAFT_259353 [Myriangium duriaei CBS 260.36]|uniref:Senescence domain-containing protein n=1 Tax=Myriangium duriaei CBS 260.36 TaxID=1168546 RepID=A0A9P4IY61_9PEZI|nr:hypothetical protein K461DRAFT_259353 [Myriangium duriaei CBS 260.36]